MEIRASKLLMTTIFSLLSFAVSFIPNLFLAHPYSVFLSQEQLYSNLWFSLALTIFLLLLSKNHYNLEVTEDKEMIGGTNYKGKVLFIRKSTLDLERTKNRTLFDRLIGRYRFYDLNGNNFRLVKYFFSKKKFKLVKERVQQTLKFTLM